MYDDDDDDDDDSVLPRELEVSELNIKLVGVDTSATAAQQGGVKDDDVAVNSIISPELKLDDCVIELV